MTGRGPLEGRTEHSQIAEHDVVVSVYSTNSEKGLGLRAS